MKIFDKKEYLFIVVINVCYWIVFFMIMKTFNYGNFRLVVLFFSLVSLFFMEYGRISK